jgi:drug/metabolite transporter (DMT)-like permease
MLLGVAISACLIGLTTAGQLLLKRAAHEGPLRVQALLAGYASLLVTVAGSFLLMHYMELKFFVVVMNLNYVSVTIASAYFFKESLDFMKIAGTGLVLAGVFIFAGVA